MVVMRYTSKTNTMTEQYNIAVQKEPQQDVLRSANDSEFNSENKDSGTEYVISNQPRAESRPDLATVDPGETTVIIADDEFAKERPRLTRADFEPQAILQVRSKAKEVPFQTENSTETIVAADEFAKHKRLTRADFSEAAIVRARQIAQGIAPENTSQSHPYGGQHTMGRINSNQEVVSSPNPETGAKYPIPVAELTHPTHSRRDPELGNLINPSATRLKRSDFPAGQNSVMPELNFKPTTRAKPSFFKRYVPSFVRSFFSR